MKFYLLDVCPHKPKYQMISVPAALGLNDDMQMSWLFSVTGLYHTESSTYISHPITVFNFQLPIVE